MTTLEHEPTDPEQDLLDPDVVDPEDQDDPELDSVSLFEGDEGGLGLAERRTLVALLRQRFISARTHPRDWQTLVEHERVLRSRLHDLFLELQLDPVREVAWKRQAVSETGQRFPTLLYDAAWSREETIVLVHLRDRYRAATAAGEERVHVDVDDLVEHVRGFRPAHATDLSGDEKRARSAVASVQKAGLLIGAPTDHRFEVSEAVESLLPLERLRELLESLQRTNDPDAGPHAGAGPATGREDDPLFDEADAAPYDAVGGTDADQPEQEQS